jgi:hypothetical protein
MLDIHSKSENPIERALSTFAPQEFIFDGVKCACIESVLQSFKLNGAPLQKEVCKKTAEQSCHIKKQFDVKWQKNQTLHWQEVKYKRGSMEYMELLTRLFDSVFEQCENFRESLISSIGEDLDHSIGLHEQTKTVLTVTEFLYQLLRLRDDLKEKRITLS